MPLPTAATIDAARERHPDVVLLFLSDEQYHCFGDDARAANELLGLDLGALDDLTYHARFPRHELERHLRTLLRNGRRVAICDAN